MWYLSFIPDIWLTYAVHAVTLVGLIGVVIGFLGSKIPFVSHYGGVVKSISTIVLLIGIYFEGSLTNEMMWHYLKCSLRISIHATTAALGRRWLFFG